MVGVTAPAGYGKSTLLAEWAGKDDRCVAWVSLDRFDDDPAALLALLATAYARILPDGSELLAAVGFGVSVLGRAAPRLASAFTASPVPFVMMLDDLHELQSAACHDVLSIVISGVPRGSQLIAASRFEQPHVPRLRASGDALDFGMSDLALDPAGAEQIFAGAQVVLTSEQASAVTERTEGWPVGLYLAALVASDDSGHGGDDLGGRPVCVGLPVTANRWASCPRAISGFFVARRCSISCALRSVRACLESRARRGSCAGSKLRTRSLSRSIASASGTDTTASFESFCSASCVRWNPTSSPNCTCEPLTGTSPMVLLCRPSSTSRIRPNGPAAHNCLPNCCCRPTNPARSQRLGGGCRCSVTPPSRPILRSPSWPGWLSLLTGQTAAAERWAAMLDTLSFDLTPLDGSASFDSSRAMFRAAFCSAGPEHMTADASFAVAQEPPESPWLNTAVYLLAEAHLLTGDVDQAAGLFDRASTLASAMSNADIVVLSGAEIAILEMDRGRWTAGGRARRTSRCTTDRGASDG